MTLMNRSSHWYIFDMMLARASLTMQVMRGIGTFQHVCGQVTDIFVAISVFSIHSTPQETLHISVKYDTIMKFYL